jgi:hypothetical protein
MKGTPRGGKAWPESASTHLSVSDLAPGVLLLRALQMVKNYHPLFFEVEHTMTLAFL